MSFERQRIAFASDLDRRSGLEALSNDFFRQRVFQIALDHTPQRPRPEDRVKASLHEKFLRRIIQLHDDVLLAQPLLYVVDFQLDNLHQVVARQRLEDDHLIDPIQKFWLEGALDLIHQLLFHLAIGHRFLR